MANCRMILVTNSTCKVIDAVRSRCLQIRVAAPTEGDICTSLQKIAASEGFDLPENLALHIARKSKRNLRQAILSLEVLKVL